MAPVAIVVLVAIGLLLLPLTGPSLPHVVIFALIVALDGRQRRRRDRRRA